MPFFKSTYNILKKCDEDEVFESKWETSNEITLPPKKDWDYQRDMQIEDVDIWEVIYEGSGGLGIYAAWHPYAEFYMITTGLDERAEPRFYKNNSTGSNRIPYWDRKIETYYGPQAGEKVYKRANELGMKVNVTKTWVENEQMWLYQPAPNKTQFHF